MAIAIASASACASACASATTMAIVGKVLSIRRSFALNCPHFIDKHEEGGGFVNVASSHHCSLNMCTCMRKT